MSNGFVAGVKDKSLRKIEGKRIVRKLKLLLILGAFIGWSMWPLPSSPSIRNILQEVAPPGAVETDSEAKLWSLNAGYCSYNAKTEIRFSGLEGDVKDAYIRVFKRIAIELGIANPKVNKSNDDQISAWSAKISDVPVYVAITRERNNGRYVIYLIIHKHAEKLGFQCPWMKFYE